MTKKDIAIRISDQTTLKQIDVKKVIQATLDCILDALIGGEKIELHNFGNFKVKQRKPHIGRNPRTGVVVPVPAHKSVVFKSGLEMKKRIKKEAR